jgi:hypothetical protein
MRATPLAVPALTIAGALALVGSTVTTGASAVETRATARTVVTIEADGTDLSGDVRSPDPACADGRTVIVIKQKGRRGGGDDRRFARDTASVDGDDYEWSTGNTGTPGRFYAKVRATPGCQRDTSPTIRAVRDDD